MLLSCGGNNLCATSQPANTNPALGDSTAYNCPLSQSCYPCKTGFVVNSGACVSTTSCDQVTGHFCATLTNPASVGAVADPNYACTSNTCYECSDPTKTWNGQSCVSPCTPSCPSASTVTCNQQITPTNACGTCSGTGTQCPSGQVCGASGCTCTPTTCTYSTTCATTGNDNCGNQNPALCTRSTENNNCDTNATASPNFLCKSGTCTCIPICNWPTDVCVASVSNGCGGTCNRPTEGISCQSTTCTTGSCNVCTNSQCQLYTLSLYYQGTTTPFDPSAVSAGDTITLEPKLSPARSDVHYSVTGAGTLASLSYPDTQYLQFAAGSIGTTGSLSVLATTNAGGTAGRATVSFTTTCLPGHTCYCPTSKYCLQSGHVVAASGYCAGGKTCGMCDSSTVIDQSDPNNLKCVAKPTTCTSTNCVAISEALPVTYPTIDCHVVANHTYKITQQSCTDPYTCAPHSDQITYNTVFGPENVTAPTDTPCTTSTGAAGLCSAGTCAVPQCVTKDQCTDFCNPVCSSAHTCTRPQGFDPRTTTEGLAAISAALLQCNATISLCGTSYTLDNVEEHACTVNGTAGVCKSGACKSPCPATMHCLASSGQYQVAHPEFACTGSNACYTCMTGTHFDNGCVASSYDLQFDVPDQTARTGEDFTITPRLTDSTGTLQANTNNEFTYYLYRSDTDTPTPSFSSFTLHFDTPGAHSLRITAAKPTGTVAEATRSLTVVCGRDVACCSEGSNAYNPDNSPCSVGGIPGTCHNAQCVLSCTPKAATETNCNDGIDDDCNGYTDCYDSACKSACGDLRCNPGQIICSNACVDRLRDNLHCGSCGNKCGTNEQCTQGACKAVEDCQIVCNKPAVRALIAQS